MSLPIFRAAGATYAFVLGNIPNLLRILWLPAVVTTAPLVWIWLQLSPVFGTRWYQALGETNLWELAERLQPISPWFNLIQYGTIAVAVIASAGILKPILRGEWTKWPFYFQLGLDEGRLALAAFISFAVRLLFALVAFVVWYVPTLLVSLYSSSQTFTFVFYCVGAIAFVAANIWIQLRLSLVAPNSIATKKIGFEQGWNFTRGQVWHLLGFWLLILGPITVLADLILFAGILSEVIPIRNVHFPYKISLPPYLSDLFLPVSYPLVIALAGGAYLLRVVGSGVVYRLLTEQPQQ